MAMLLLVYWENIEFFLTEPLLTQLGPQITSYNNSILCANLYVHFVKSFQKS